MSAETTDGALEVISGVQGRPARLAVLISGGGTTLLNFLEQMKAGLLPVEIPLVISSPVSYTHLTLPTKA